MTTKEQWKAGILIAGMLIIAVALSYSRIGRYVAQSQARPAYQPPPAPVAAAPVVPQYPIHKMIAVTQNGWSEEITINDGEQLEWSLLNDSAWLDTRANRSEEFRQFPSNDSRWKRLTTKNGTRILEFRITLGTPVQSANLEITVRKTAGGDFSAREERLPSVTPSLTDAGVKAGPQWPSELTPTRITTVWSKNLIPGNIVHDKIYPIEDVLYKIESGWTLTPFADSPDGAFQSVPAPQGVRVRLLNPYKSVEMQFKITRDISENTLVSAQPLVTRQAVPNWNSTTPPSAIKPVVPPYVRPYVPPQRPSVIRQQPSYYPTYPTGPSYYPSQHNR